MAVRVFYLDESAYNPGDYLIRVNVEKIPFTVLRGSLNILAARLMNLTYADYLRFCRDVLGADVRGKNSLYPVAYFKRNKATEQFIKLLNKRAELVLWERDHPNFVDKTIENEEEQKET